MPIHTHNAHTSVEVCSLNAVCIHDVASAHAGALMVPIGTRTRTCPATSLGSDGPQTGQHPQSKWAGDLYYWPGCLTDMHSDRDHDQYVALAPSS